MPSPSPVAHPGDWRVYYDLENPIEDYVTRHSTDLEAINSVEEVFRLGYLRKDRESDASKYMWELVPVDRIVRVQIHLELPPPS